MTAGKQNWLLHHRTKKLSIFLADAAEEKTIRFNFILEKS